MTRPSEITQALSLSAPDRAGIVLSSAEFQGLADMPPELEWFASLESLHTRRAYERDIQDFMGFTGIDAPLGFRLVNRAHVLAWRRALEARALSGATIRRKLAALASTNSCVTAMRLSKIR